MTKWLAAGLLWVPLTPTLTPLSAQPPAHPAPRNTPSGYDLFQVIARYAEARAAEARTRNDPVAATGWEIIRNTYRGDDKTNARLRTQTQGEVVLGFQTALIQAQAETPRYPANGLLTWQILFLSELSLDNLTTREGTGWVVGKERLEKLHREVCAEVAVHGGRRPDTLAVRPAQPVPAVRAPHPLADPAPRPLMLPPARNTSPAVILPDPYAPLPADVRANVGRAEQMASWYAEEKKKWDRRDAERQKKWEENLRATEAGKPLPHSDVPLFPASMAATVSLVEDANKAIDALTHPAKYTPAERERILNRMRGHEQANRALNSDLAWRQLMTKFEREVHARQTNRIEEHFRINPAGPLPSPSIYPTIR